MQNQNHTPWYRADEPDNGPAPLPPQRSASMPFRFVVGAPYPEHEEQPDMVDLLSGEKWQRGGSLRQPVAEDFLRGRVGQVGQGGGVEEEDGEEGKWEGEWNGDGEASPSPTPPPKPAAYTPSRPLPSPSPSSPLPKRPHSAAAAPSPHPLTVATRPPLTVATQTPPIRVPVIPSDFFSPVYGGLQRLPSAPVKESKTRRFKRWLGIGGKRKYGRASV